MKLADTYDLAVLGGYGSKGNTMSTTKKLERIRQRSQKFLAAFMVAVCITLATVMIAFAHHPVTAGTAECVNGKIQITASCTAWQTNEADARRNHEVVARMREDGAAWTPVYTDTFRTSNEYTFSYVFTPTHQLTGVLQISCLAVPRWGRDEDRGDPNQFTIETVEYPDNCTPPGVTVTVIKTVTNDNNGTLGIQAFSFQLDGTGSFKSGEKINTTPGIHSVSEIFVDGYGHGPWGGDCEADGTFTAVAGQNIVCTIHNDDNDVVVTMGDIAAQKRDDKNGNGKVDPGDDPIEDWAFILTNGVVTHTATSDASGFASFHVAFGRYTLCEEHPENWTSTNGPVCRSVEIIADKIEAVTVLFLNHNPSVLVVFKFEDLSLNGDPDEGELGVGGVEVVVYNRGTTDVVTRTTTLTTPPKLLGYAKVVDLPDGEYTVCETVPPGWNPTAGACREIVMTNGQVTSVNIGNVKPPPTDLDPGQQPTFRGLLLPYLSH